jgi:hypothetical protein
MSRHPTDGDFEGVGQRLDLAGLHANEANLTCFRIGRDQ